jgi:hypothetical protein
MSVEQAVRSGRRERNRGHRHCRRLKPVALATRACTRLLSVGNKLRCGARTALWDGEAAERRSYSPPIPGRLPASPTVRATAPMAIPIVEPTTAEPMTSPRPATNAPRQINARREPRRASLISRRRVPNGKKVIDSATSPLCLCRLRPHRPPTRCRQKGRHPTAQIVADNVQDRE